TAASVAHSLLKHFDGLAETPGAADKLRRVILELAFSGRLVKSAEQWRETTVDNAALYIQPGFACAKKNQTPDGHVHLRTHNISTNGRLNFDLLVKIEPELIDSER